MDQREKEIGISILEGVIDTSRDHLKFLDENPKEPDRSEQYTQTMENIIVCQKLIEEIRAMKSTVV